MSQLSKQTSPDPQAAALVVLDVFAQAANLSFDRLLAARVLGEVQRAIPGDDATAWARRLVEVGESLDLRIRSIECPLSDVLVFAQQQIPVAMCQEAQGGLRWILISEARNNSVRLVSTENRNQARWISMGALLKMLGTSDDDASVRWVVGQPALACEPASSRSDTADHEHPSPLGRLFGLIRPERSDIGAVIVFSIVVGILALASPIAVEALVNTVAFGRYLQPVIILALMLLTFLGFAAAIRTLNTYVVEIIQRRLFVRVVEDLAYRLPRVEQAALDGQYGPELTNRFFDVVTVQKVTAALLLDGIAIVLQTVIGMAVLAFYHPFLLGFDFALLVSIAFAIFVLGRGAVKTAVKESKVKYAVAAWMEELTRNPTAFKMHGGMNLALERADKLAVDYLDARKKHFRIVLRQIVFALVLQAVAATALLGLGGWLVIMGELTLGQLVAAELIVMMIVGSFAKLGKHMESFYDLLASVDKLGLLFDLPVESRNKLFHLRDDTAATVLADQLSYRYGATTVLGGLSFELEAGERVGLSGPAGAGKSTLIDLLSGMRKPQGGHVEIEGIDLRELRPDSLRDHIALSRGVEIFHGTIAENIHLHRPQINARDIRDALDAVGLLEGVLKMPEGLNTLLQSDGKPLSSSQAQRLMLARAIAGRPQLLLIDGSLDGLSGEVLSHVMQGLTTPERRWTLVIATNRQEILEACDRVISLVPENPANSTSDAGIESH